MTEQEYHELQANLSRKLLIAYTPHEMRSGKYNEGYKTGILSAKSILKDFFASHREFKEERK